ncbi:nucleotidyltransferase family protein [Ilumatobacter sp.]|uniref:nucleotidyltransferase family protein n=1 Tax=Ilumatobacter sp. TaxID=1967498 RepID=UPI003AF40F37
MSTPTAPTLAVVLAAGGGSRFGGPHHKLLAPLNGERVAQTAIRHALDARIGPVVVVTGAADLTEVLAAVGGHDHPDGAPAERPRPIHNARWADGQATSLQLAVADARRLGVKAVVVGLADQPFVDPVAWRRVAASASPIAVATYGGARRNPVRLHRSVWPLLPTAGDEGARSVTRLHPELVEEVPCPGSPADIDTLEDLASWQNRS